MGGPKVSQLQLPAVCRCDKVGMAGRSALEMLRAPPERRLGLGCPHFDQLLRGGFTSRGINEISGEAGTGKTNLCLQLCLQVQLPQEQGGLDGIVPPAALHGWVCVFRQRCVYYFGRCTYEAAAPDVSCVSAAASCNLARQSYTNGLNLYGAR